jgi:small subunit ribosomal protein S20
MPITLSAIRRAKKSNIQTAVNKIRKSKYKSAIKKMNAYIISGNMKDAKTFLPKFYSELMKVAKTGVIKKKTASRKISKITKKIQNSKK